MPKRLVSISRAPQRWDLEIVSHGRRGPADTIRLTPAQIEQVARTVRRTPEVVVKVSGGARDPGGAKAHFDYIDRHGKLELETDDGRALQGKQVGAELVEDWNLDLSEGQYRAKPGAGEKEGRFDPGPGKERLLATRRKVVADWMATAAALREQGETALAQEVESFVKAMQTPKTEQEQIAAGLIAQIEAQRKGRDARGNTDGGRTS